MSNSTRITLLALIAVALLGAGYGLGYYLNQGEAQPVTQMSTDCPVCKKCSEPKVCPESIAQQESGGFQEGWEAAKKRLEETGLSMEPEEVTELRGEIVSLSDEQIELKITPITPLADPELDSRIVKIEANTEILLKKERDFALYEKEMQAYDKEMRKIMEQEEFDAEAIETLGDAPEMFVTEQTGVESLTEGVSVQVSAGTDIKNEKSFTAVTISVDESALKMLEEMKKMEAEMKVMEAKMAREELVETEEMPEMDMPENEEVVIEEILEEE